MYPRVFRGQSPDDDIEFGSVDCGSMPWFDPSRAHGDARLEDGAVGKARRQLVILQKGVIEREERCLEQKLGEAYLRHKASGRRWIERRDLLSMRCTERPLTPE